MSASGSLSRTVFKVTGLFGGTQIVSLLGSVLRTKLIAIWIGEQGIGLFGLFNAAVDMICSVSQLSLRSSAVRDVSELAATDNETALRRLVKAVRRWGWGLGLIGLLIMMIAAPFLAISTFDNPYILWPFALLAAVVLLNSVTETEKAVMQGMRRFGDLAKMLTITVIVGCLVSIPMIYYWRLDCVAPVILAYSLTGFLVMMFYRRRSDSDSSPQTVKETVALGSKFVKLGFYMTIAGSLAYASSYIFLTYMNLSAGTDVVGAYQAGYTLSVRYVGFLFAAIGVEYYPRLSAAASRGVMRIGVFMRHEARLLCLMITAAAVVMSAGAPLIVSLLYTSEFTSTAAMIQWAAPGLVLRAASWCVAFVILAHGAGAAYFRCELASTLIGLALNVAAFMLWGVAGVGASFTVWYIVYYAIVALVVRKKYGITIGRRVGALVMLCFVSVALVSWTALFVSSLVGGFLAGVVVCFCCFLLLRRRRR